MTVMEDIKKKYDELSARLDTDLAIHDELYRAFVDGAEGEDIKNDFSAKSGKGVGEIPKGKVNDGATGEKPEKGLNSKAGSGSTGDVPKAKEPVVDGATGTKLKKV